jgi:hypothetical protein
MWWFSFDFFCKKLIFQFLTYDKDISSLKTVVKQTQVEKDRKARPSYAFGPFKHFQKETKQFAMF